MQRTCEVRCTFTALKTNTFDWGKLGQFYLTMVAPYVLTCAGLYAVGPFVPELLNSPVNP